MNMTSSLRNLNPRKLVPSVLVVQKMETASSVTDQCVISLSLLANINPHAITQPDLRIGWEELLGEPFKQYAGLVQQQGHRTDCRVPD